MHKPGKKSAPIYPTNKGKIASGSMRYSRLAANLKVSSPILLRVVYSDYKNNYTRYF